MASNFSPFRANEFSPPCDAGPHPVQEAMGSFRGRPGLRLTGAGRAGSVSVWCGRMCSGIRAAATGCIQHDHGTSALWLVERELPSHEAAPRGPDDDDRPGEAQCVQHLGQCLSALRHREGAGCRAAVAVARTVHHDQSVAVTPGVDPWAVDAVIGQDGWPEHDHLARKTGRPDVPDREMADGRGHLSGRWDIWWRRTPRASICGHGVRLK